MRHEAATLRRLLDGTETAMLLEAHDAVSAKLVEEAGFDAIWASSLTLSCSLGVPDAGLAMDHRLDVLESMTGGVGIPVLFDGDTGGRTPEAFVGLIRRVEARSVAGVCIEDKALPKRNSFARPESQILVSSEEFCTKLQAGVHEIAERDFVIVARTEALIVGKGLEEAVRRARAYAEAGAHAVLVHSRQGDLGEIAAFMKKWDLKIPVMCIPTTYSATPFEEFERSGIAAVIWANHMLRSAVAAMSHSSKRLRQTRCAGTIEGDIAPVSRLLALQGEDADSASAAAPSPAHSREPAVDRPRATAVAEALLRAGVTDASGVPCAILEPLQQAIEASPLRYVGASVEGEAVALAAAAWLAGRGGVVQMQNSGLGNTVNPLVSLVVPYRIPMLFVISWRGQPGTPDAVHHQPMGALTLPLLQQLGVRTWVLDGTAAAGDVVERAARWSLRERRIGAVVVPRHFFAPTPRRVAAVTPAPTDLREPLQVPCRFVDRFPPSRARVIEQFRARHGSSIAVSTTGLCSRALHESGPADHHFYMQGSMGFALAIGLGVARGTPKSVFVLDGDGALIMRMGTMATVGRARPPNLIHIVMDNRVYSSTGGQPTAGCVDFAQVALACGYRRSASCDGAGQLDDALEWVTREPGPTLLHIRVTTDESDAPPNRPEVAPDELAERFRLHVSRTAAEATAEGPGPAP